MTKFLGRLRAAVAVLSILGAVLVATPGRADAHTFGGSYTKRIGQCASGQTPSNPEGKYACEAHYLLSVDDPVYGPLWDVRHSHGCTDQASSGQKWTLNVLIIRSGSSDVWNALHSGHDHTTDWCNQAQPNHDWYPEVYVVRSNNQFQVATDTYHCIPGECYWQGFETTTIWNT
jgi:hypothetical protein